MLDTLLTKARNRPAVVIGAGTMGTRIALMLATQGGEVRLFDRSVEATQRGLAYIQHTLPQVIPTVKGGKAGPVHITTALDDALKDAWLVIEALPEKLDLKIDIFGQLEQYAPKDALLTTTSSSFPSRHIIGHVKDTHRVFNTHFMMPPDKRAVEIMSCGATEPSLMEGLAAYFTQLGLSPYLLKKESMGFIQNRIWAAIKREALCVAAEGITEPETIDRIYRETIGTAQGPFQLMDQVGLDIVLQIEEHYAAVFPHLPEAPRQLLREMIAENRLGIKTGRGFYSYGKETS
ncbi:MULTISPECIES: 3-hydroxyacyl-CoA dehydrogenase family protein [Bombella]|uniref:3-hydroxyacyl-CoA dehydrogenase family protein n=2 Tax=Bombella TaxID=1654741 RepID=A0ABT3WJ51_9PROT|nr:MULTISPECIES: 3-hydroxyacyl-CoA dehydrogenase family protein [Bombella]PHI96696.1 3-hydroxybutyryl-CoA dehydrogenase [Parasaccharibacter apium]MCX5614695.1 3-hydroxyacyl-CoA dehydrogenase family protein [Bombella saccharophila]MCX5618953.1 3-hydroxyacyl-CoA dehydrogenase family protein [Bombella pollinis]MUG04030.1 3-hydroxyacyl-CoA dehydrogenase family protein [Bombella sp. ESL0378]MUG89524.1 3-hydroxyacyl-CoA dehydrogenase family protein [Bombella sp. ESL0385]